MKKIIEILRKKINIKKIRKNLKIVINSLIKIIIVINIPEFNNIIAKIKNIIPY